MGFERLVRGPSKQNFNYDTDVFTGLIEATEKLTAKNNTNTDSRQDVAFRVLADLHPGYWFTIADGQLPIQVRVLDPQDPPLFVIIFLPGLQTTCFAS
jgi:alanyl-tRNA synthetase